MARIIVADDSADMRHLLSTLLVERGHTVQIADNGFRAMELMKTQQPDLLVLDIIMPGLDGYGVLREMKNQGIRDDIKILILSAKTSEADIVKGYKLGADRYVTKPFGADELLNTIQTMIDSQKQDLRGRTEEELDKAQLLSRLESMFSDF